MNFSISLPISAVKKKKFYRDCVESVDQVWGYCHINILSLPVSEQTQCFPVLIFFQQCVVVFSICVLHLFV